MQNRQRRQDARETRRSKDRAHKLPCELPPSALAHQRWLPPVAIWGVTFPKHVQLCIWKPSLTASTWANSNPLLQHQGPPCKWEGLIGKMWLQKPDLGLNWNCLKNESIGTINKKGLDSFLFSLFLSFFFFFFLQLNPEQLANLGRQPSHYHSWYGLEFLRNDFFLRSVELNPY